MSKPENRTRTTMRTAEPARSGDAGHRKSRHPWVPEDQPTFEIAKLDAVDWLAKLPSESVDLLSQILPTSRWRSTGHGYDDAVERRARRRATTGSGYFATVAFQICSASCGAC